jgi:PIN domain nuclease of toxin-antitoxin system
LSLLADACALIAFHGYGGETMSQAGKTALSTGDVFVSPITVWEITRKVALGKLDRPCPPGFNGSLAAWLRSAGYRPLPLSWDAAERANALPNHHKDPMDRMLIATALERGCTIITDDAVFDAYGVTTIW